MIITKALYLNRFEPAIFNLRAPMGIEAKIDVTYFMNGSNLPYDQDVAGQLQLTSRTGRITSFYAMPAIDVVNGKARAVIPADFLDDPNGYRLNIVGTFDGEPVLLATGTLYPLASAGPQAVPQDVIDQIDIRLNYNVDAEMTVALWHDAAKSTPYDLSTVTLAAPVLDARDGLPLAEFAVSVLGNVATLTMPAATVNTLPPACWWRLVAAGAAGSQTLAEGDVTISGTPTP